MKKILSLIILFLMILVPVKAANYEMRELIPKDITTTIKSKTFLYKNIKYHDGVISFEKIENQSDESSPIKISIGLFNEERKNIGTINLCTEEVLSSKEERLNYTIFVEKRHLGDNNKIKDIKYISVLSGNDNCRTGGEHDYLGQSVEDIGMAKNNTLTDSAMLLLDILKIIVIILVVLFLIKFLFTNAYQNMDGSDIRAGFRDLNNDLRKERESELKKNPPKPKEKKKVKTDEVIEQEKKEKENERKDNSDLHNMYK